MQAAFFIILICDNGWITGQRIEASGGTFLQNTLAFFGAHAILLK